MKNSVGSKNAKTKIIAKEQNKAHLTLQQGQVSADSNGEETQIVDKKQSKEQVKKLIFNVLISVLSVAIVGGLSAIFNIQNRDWYDTLVKPPFTPPNQVFGIVWNVLYAMLAVSLFFALQKGISKKLTLLFVLNGVLNILWSISFFTLKNQALGFIVLIANVLVAILTILELAKNSSKISTILFVPYVLWLLFALILNYSIIMLN